MGQKNRQIGNPGLSNEYLLEQTFKMLHAPLVFYAVKFVGDSEIGKDLVQDAFLSLLNKKNIEEEVANLKSYLYRSVRNNCLNYLNHKIIADKYQETEKKLSKLEIGYYDSHETIVEKELHFELQKAIDELPEQYKIPFRMSRFEDKKNKEIAEELGIPLRTIETQIYRALIHLRKKLNKTVFNLFSVLLHRQNQTIENKFS